MKRIVAGTMAAAALIAFSAQAAKMDADNDGKVSKAEFVASKQAQAKEKGEEFDKAKAEKQFATRDKNSDGFLSTEERAKKKSE